MDWKLTDAQNRFNELVRRALAEGPQRVKCDSDVVIVVAERDYEKLAGNRLGFKEFLVGEGPSFEGLDLARDAVPMRGARKLAKTN